MIGLRAENVQRERRPSARPVVKVWRLARDAAEAQVAQLVDALWSAGDDAAQEIARDGFKGLSRRLHDPIQQALVAYDCSALDSRIAAAALLQAAVQEMTDFVVNDPVLTLMEENPYGVPITIRAALRQALEQIARQVRSPSFDGLGAQ